MILYDPVLGELRARWRNGTPFISKDDLVRWSESSGLSVLDFLDTLAVELSIDFWISVLTYDFVCLTANNLNWAWIDLTADTSGLEWPDTFGEFYWAFDHSDSIGTKDREIIREFLQKHRTLT